MDVSRPAEKKIPNFLEDVRLKVSDLVKPQQEIN